MVTTTYHDATFGVREIGARTDAAGTSVDDLPLEQDALINAILTEGFLTSGAFKVAADSPASMDVIVGSGTAKADLYVVETDETGRHPYIVRLDDASVTITLDAADASNSRIDEIWLVVRDPGLSGDAGSLALPRLAYRKGDPDSTPSAPGADAAWAASVKLATITVGASTPNIESGDVADNRKEAVLATGRPVGEMTMTAASATPTGWLECDGSAVSRSTYARLFAAIGTSYGAGDGSTTFKLPDMRDRFPAGAGTSYSRGSTGGEAEHTLTTAETPSHSHAKGTLAISGGTHDHDVMSDQYQNFDGGAGGTILGVTGIKPDGSGPEDRTGTTESAGHSHTVSGSTASVGSGDAHENRPPYLGVRFIIFAAA